MPASCAALLATFSGSFGSYSIVPSAQLLLMTLMPYC
jgi:hypothetical protein